MFWGFFFKWKGLVCLEENISLWLCPLQSNNSSHLGLVYLDGVLCFLFFFWLILETLSHSFDNKCSHKEKLKVYNLKPWFLDIWIIIFYWWMLRKLRLVTLGINTELNRVWKDLLLQCTVVLSFPASLFEVALPFKLNT